MKRTLAIALAAAAVFATSAQAITYGTEDGQLHPYVGGLVDMENGWPYCSGSLVSPTVFVTAAHCADGARVAVSFDEHIEFPKQVHWGTWYQHPGYYNNESNPLDVAVVVFDKPVRAETSADIAPLNLLSDMKAAGTLNQETAFTSVGYGANEDEPPHGDFSFTYLDTRQWAIGYYDALGPGYLRISQNPHAGSGGTCYGDSGGPQFLGDQYSNLQVSVTVTGDLFCKSTNVVQRLDIAEVQDWLAQFIALD